MARPKSKTTSCKTTPCAHCDIELDEQSVKVQAAFLGDGSCVLCNSWFGFDEGMEEDHNPEDDVWA